jgi:hypothetical protein
MEDATDKFTGQGHLLSEVQQLAVKLEIYRLLREDMAGYYQLLSTIPGVPWCLMERFRQQKVLVKALIILFPPYTYPRHNIKS